MNVRALKRTVAAVAVAAALAGAYSLGNSTTVDYVQAAGQTALGAIVAKNGPAVVNISVSGPRKTSVGMPDLQQLDPNDPLYQFFRHFGAPQQSEAPTHGLGSGFIIHADGTILTNAHVVDGADEVIVKLTDKREFEARVIGLDMGSDVAVLKIDARNLPVVKNGNAAKARVGDRVLAIGSPFGFENSATAGIVSAKSRSLPDGGYVSFIQTDAAVNPGSSGGPLFNMAGEVIGMNAQIYSQSGGYQGLSFAIPIEVVMNVEQQIVTHGKVQRGWLGVSIQEVNQSLAASFGLKKTAGALVNMVGKDSPAEKAGVEPGDIILGINGNAMGSSRELPAIVANIRPGETAKLQVWRNGDTRRIDVQVGALSDEQLARKDSQDADKGRLGVTVRALTPEEQSHAHIKGGVVVDNVSGATARADLQPGDIVLSVNGEPITNAEELNSLVAKAGKHIALLIERHEARLFIPIDLG